MNLNELTSKIDHDILCRTFSTTFAEIYGNTSVQYINERDMEKDSAFLQGLEEIKVSDRPTSCLESKTQTEMINLIVQSLDLWTDTRIQIENLPKLADRFYRGIESH
jgi:hypothetical protein